ncbi:MAG: hypothetical protein Q9Q40_05560 [Acidobacteriota bacterium]|nr:hypothetical protein [Acidobacteriota bacterium]MDQ7087781.1 hypothetical protein [Acidobacteriota bacterium]
MRPTFHLDLPLACDEVMRRLELSIARTDCPCHGRSLARHAEIWVDDARRKIWSPWLSLTIEAREEGCHLRGRFSPSPSVWTFFMFLHFFFAFLLFVGSLYGFSQWTLGRTPWALGVIPVATGGMVGVYLASLIGQRLGAEQMAMLRKIVDDALGLSPAGDAERACPPHRAPIGGSPAR